VKNRDPYTHAAQAFWGLLANGRKTQPTFEDVEKLHRKWRNGITDPDELPTILNLLESQEKIEFLRNDKKNRTRITKIRLLNIDKTSPKKIKAELEEEVPVRHWKLKEVKLSNSSQIGYFKKLNQYLLDQNFFNCSPIKWPLVPTKELSLEIFGDEKYIDNKRTGETLYNGRLNLKDIGCQIVVPPLVYNHPLEDNKRITISKDYKPVIILENYASYWSFKEVNLNDVSPKYSAICFGDGKYFFKQHLEMDKEIPGLAKKEIFYLGDIDPDGILIPTGINNIRASAGEKTFKPSLHYYRLMLEHGQEQDNQGKNIAEDRKKDAILAVQAWFSDDPHLADRIIDVISRNQRIPQECIGLKLLRQKGIFQ
jgi:hypothetical protein